MQGGNQASKASSQSKNDCRANERQWIARVQSKVLAADQIGEDQRQGKTGVMGILREAKRLAQQYRRATGKPLGITGEVAEYEAARIRACD